MLYFCLHITSEFFRLNRNEHFSPCHPCLMAHRGSSFRKLDHRWTSRKYSRKLRFLLFKNHLDMLHIPAVSFLFSEDNLQQTCSQTIGKKTVYWRQNNSSIDILFLVIKNICLYYLILERIISQCN